MIHGLDVLKYKHNFCHAQTEHIFSQLFGCTLYAVIGSDCFCFDIIQKIFWNSILHFKSFDKSALD